jgi:hypothetical protein
MAGITLAKAIQVFGRELGCTDADTQRDYLIDEITDAIEYLMLHGGGDILKEWILPVNLGKTTLPRDLETPVKYKFGSLPNSGFGTFHSPYLSYSSQGIVTDRGYNEWNPRLAVSANRVFTQYEPPKCGVRLVATTRNCDDVGKKIMVGGKQRGMEVAPMHFGHKTSGELLTIYHEDDPAKKYGAYVFDQITSVTKDLTDDYVMLSGIDSQDSWYHLSWYHPDEETPSYREMQFVTFPLCPNAELCVHILGRTNPSIRYIRDEDILPINSLQLLKYLAKRAKYEDGGDFNELATMEQRVQALIKKLVAYQQAPNRHLSMSLGASGHSLKNV